MIHQAQLHGSSGIETAICKTRNGEWGNGMRGTQECWGMSGNIEECRGMSGNVGECRGMLRNFGEWWGMLGNVGEC